MQFNSIFGQKWKDDTVGQIGLTTFLLGPRIASCSDKPIESGRILYLSDEGLSYTKNLEKQGHVSQYPCRLPDCFSPRSPVKCLNSIPRSSSIPE